MGDDYDDGYQGGINVKDNACYCMKQKSCTLRVRWMVRLFRIEKIAPAKALYVATYTRNSASDGKNAAVDRVYVNGQALISKESIMTTTMGYA